MKDFGGDLSKEAIAVLYARRTKMTLSEATRRLKKGSALLSSRGQKLLTLADISLMENEFVQAYHEAPDAPDPQAQAPRKR